MLKAARRGWRQPDHFHWLTALLARRGAQSTTCRVIAATVVGFGALPVAMIWSPAGPAGHRDQLIAVIVAVCCLAMALAWLRRSWPTRVQSGLFVVTATLCIAAGCLIQANPLAGIAGSAAFAVLAGYIAVFHTARYRVFTMSVALATAAVLAMRLASGGDAVLGVCALGLVAVVTAAVAFACRALVLLLGIDVISPDIDPLTGLLNRQAFDRMTGTLVASRSRDDDRYLAVAVVNLDNFGLLCDSHGSVAGDRARVAVGQTLRETTRHNAVVAHVQKEEFLIADTFTSTDPAPWIERVRSAIATTPPRLSASIGVVSTPLRGLVHCPPQDVLDELVTIATAAMYDARRSGGNQVRHVPCARLAVLGDRHPF